MRICATDPEGPFYHVYLNGKHVPHAVAADDEEGWVDVIDAKAMAPLIQVDTQKIEKDGKFIHAPVYANEASPDVQDDESTWTPIQTVRLKGEIELRRI
jgi:hypothetical protein